jgi:glycosyltransferase involved in cell wall biosynthesis
MPGVTAANMRVGLVARADDRGLGMMTWEVHRHLHITRTLVVREPGAEAHGFQPHLDRYRLPTVVTFNAPNLPEPTVRAWLDGLDVVYGAETWYDERFPRWAAEAGVATVLHAMPEFYRPEMASTVTWAPTRWRLDLLPAGDMTRVVPVPVDPRPIARPHTHEMSRLRVVHVVGRRAAADRNGTLVLARALPYLRDCDVRVWCQDRRLPAMRRPARVGLDVRLGGVADRWSMYEGADVLVLPRRYGGLCLPALEAMACGLAVVMPDCSPNDEWPTIRVPAVRDGELRAPGGVVERWNADPRALAQTINRLGDRPELLTAAKAAAAGWAATHSWERLAGVYETALADACT